MFRMRLGNLFTGTLNVLFLSGPVIVSGCRESERGAH